MFMTTFTGFRVNPHTLTAADVCIEDVARSLTAQCRFNGHIRNFYSVAAHSMAVARMLAQDGHGYLCYHAVLHDAHEAYMGDLVTPMKSALGEVALRRWREIESVVDSAIHTRFGLPWPLPEDDARTLKHYDLLALAVEKQCLVNDPDPWPGLPAPAPHHMLYHPPRDMTELEHFRRHLIAIDNHVVLPPPIDPSGTMAQLSGEGCQ